MTLPRCLPRLLLPAPPRGLRHCSICTPRPSRPPAPTCAPCEPKTRPPCRARLPAKKAVLHVTCCPPPQGHPPPCPVAPPACSLNCSNFKSSTKKPVSSVKSDVGCSRDRDRVAIRLAAAREFRRQEYLREAAERKPPPPPNDPPFRLGGSNVCARVVADKVAPCPDGTCGPDRQPPPPRCVELKPESECTVRRSNTVDPCAHQPRVIVNIDRSRRPHSPAAPAASPAPETSYAEGLTSRIMKSLNLSRSDSDGKTSCGKTAEPQLSSVENSTGKAKSTHDSSWCQSMPQRPDPPTCNPPRSGAHVKSPTNPGAPTRNLHTTALRFTKSAPLSNHKEDANKLKSMLSERECLKEVARGRVVRDETSPEAGGAGGALELGVPAGVSSVRVLVTLNAAPGTEPPPSRSKCPPVQCATAPEASLVSCTSRRDAAGKTDSWLKKIVDSCRKTDNSSVVKLSKKSDSDSCKSKVKAPCHPKVPINPCPQKVPANPCSPPPTPCDSPFPPPPAPAPPKPCKPATPKPCKPVPANPCAPTSNSKSKSSETNKESKNKSKPVCMSRPLILLTSV